MQRQTMQRQTMQSQALQSQPQMACAQAAALHLTVLQAACGATMGLDRVPRGLIAHARRIQAASTPSA